MGKRQGSYIGGSTVIGPGLRWSDHLEFPEPELLTHPRQTTKDKPHKGKKKLGKISKTPAQSALPTIQKRQVELICSILKDLGREPSKRRNRFNNVLRKLIEGGVIHADGSVNHESEVIQGWLEKVDGAKKRVLGLSFDASNAE